MRRVVGALLAVLVVLGVAGCSGSHSAAGSGASGDTVTVTKVGGPLPDVTLPGLRSSGRPIDLGRLKGPAVINLWANWCSPCRAEMPLIEKFHRSNPDVEVIGVNALDTKPGLALQVADQAGVTYPLVVDKDRAIDVIGLPRTLLVDADGKVTYSAYAAITSVAELEGLVKQYLPTSGTGR